MSRDDKNLRSTLAQIATVIVVFLAIAVGLLAYAVLAPQGAIRPQHYTPVKIDQNIRVQVTCQADGSMVQWIPPTMNGKG